MMFSRGGLEGAFDEDEGVIKEKYQMRNTGYNTGLSVWRSVWARMLATP